MKNKNFIFICLLFLNYQNAIAGWPDVIEPPQSQSKKMVKEMYVNGVPVSVKFFNSRLSPERVVSFYRNRWADNFAESDSGPWQQISQLTNKYFITVQVKDGNDRGTQGRINITKLTKNKRKVGKDIPMMLQSTILSEVVTKDELTISTMILLFNEYSVDENIQFYKNYFSKDNWVSIIDKSRPDIGSTQVYKNETDELSVTIKSVAGISTVVLNKVVKRGWFN